MLLVVIAVAALGLGANSIMWSLQLSRLWNHTEIVVSGKRREREFPAISHIYLLVLPIS